jgi:hypothetical protein
VLLPLVLGKWKYTVSEIICNTFSSMQEAKQWHSITGQGMINKKYKTTNITKQKFKGNFIYRNISVHE